MARLTCCVPKSIPGIPDGSTSKAIRVCLYSVDRLAFNATTTATLQFNPWVPTPVSLVTGSGATIINGKVIIINAGVSGLGFGIPPAFSSVPISQSRPGATNNAVDIYNATSMRIISQTHAIRYTGPVNSCAGIIRSFPNDWNLMPAGTVTSTSSSTVAPTANGVCAQYLNELNAIAGYAPLGTPILSLDGPTLAALNVGPNSVSCRPEQGMTIRLAHKTGKYESVPVCNIPPVVAWYPNSTGNTLVTLNHYFPSNTVNQPFVLGYDNDWVSQAVILENVNADASYSIESCVCVEFVPTSGSAFYPLTQGSPPANIPLLHAVQRTINDHGTAVPGILNSMA